MSDKKEKLEITGINIFADLGLKNSEELLVRSEFLSEINHSIKSCKLSQKEIARILNITPSKVFMLTSGNLSAFSTDALRHYLRSLGQS